MMRVLIVDDDRLARTGLINLLPWKQFGLQVVGEANNGEKALEFLKSNEVELLITDLAMPVLSGIDLMRKVRELYPNMFIVVLSYHQDFELVQEALRLGAIDYIAKIQLEKAKLEEVLERITSRIQFEWKQRFIPSQGEPASRQPVNEEVQARIMKELIPLDWLRNDSQHARLTDYINQHRLQLDTFLETRTKLLGKLDPILPEEHKKPSHAIPNIAEWHANMDALRTWFRNESKLMQYSIDIIEAILRAAHYIQEHLSDDLHLDEVARKVGVSRSYFSECFKEIIGISFQTYLRNTRLAFALKLLEETTLPVYAISQKAGYPNEKYFSKVFRSLFNLLPSEFRMKGLKSSDILASIGRIEQSSSFIE
ncbi:two-component system, response regulator YesN [Paenibacillus catalpae]|uniref:Two-component system, response regulator YesN n=1 Tax=Paenibacillus catalpae TaxID=1045775 RepID=A0A1I1SY87_9BACL|nr:response regulator [Paenibacillus catalpae]SFD48903.1 two-component system, response regulator YesN [Paenibacillus catalpae]